MTLGARAAGIDVRAAVENHPSACLTFRTNHPGAMMLESDIADVGSIDTGQRNAPLVLFGGPPCQGFSTSNQRTRHAANPKNWLFREFLRLVNTTRPEWVVFENVSGILQTNGGIHRTRRQLAGRTRHADAAARKLRRKLNLPSHDLDDLRQELLVDLIAPMPSYDPARGPQSWPRPGCVTSAPPASRSASRRMRSERRERFRFPKRPAPSRA
jgi:C-5 cytosine-specific DNA methylase